MTEKKEYFIVWNGDRSEGFITDDPWAARNADLGRMEFRERDGFGQSTLGMHFGETYRDDEDDKKDAPPIQRVEFEKGE